MAIDSRKLLYTTGVHNVSGRSVIAIKFVPNTQNRLQAPFPDAPQPRRPSHLPSEKASCCLAHHSHGNPQKFTPQVVVTPRTLKNPYKNHRNWSDHHHGRFFFVCDQPPGMAACAAHPSSLSPFGCPPLNSPTRQTRLTAASQPRWLASQQLLFPTRASCC